MGTWGKTSKLAKRQKLTTMQTNQRSLLKQMNNHQITQRSNQFANSKPVRREFPHQIRGDLPGEIFAVTNAPAPRRIGRHDPRDVRPERGEGPPGVVELHLRSFCGWTKSISHHPRHQDKPWLVGIDRGAYHSRVSQVLPKRISSMHSLAVGQNAVPLVNIKGGTWVFRFPKMEA